MTDTRDTKNHKVDDAANAQHHRLLVIDDNRAIHDDFRKILVNAAQSDAVLAEEAALFGEPAPPSNSVQHYRLDSAYQGEEGLGLVQRAIEEEEPYSVAFVDMRMPPGWDGLETIERIFAADEEVQIVICTAYSDYSWNQIIDRLGSSDRLLILKKPFDCAEVRQLAAALSEKWRISRKLTQKVWRLEGEVQQRLDELTESNERLRDEIKQREQAESRLRHHALHDSLTSLPNRMLLMDRLGRCCERSRREKDHCFAVLYMDIDDFKVINDSMGHPFGDELLNGVANRLLSSVRSMDSASRSTASTTSRLGGDEFVILLDNISQAQDAVDVADRIHRALKEPFLISGQEAVAAVSVGIAVGQGNYQCPDDILRDADTALYEAKRRNKGCHSIFDSKMRSQVMERLEIETDLRKAIERDELSVAYQPILNLNSGELIGFEALMRWCRAGGRHVPPDLFIPIAEDTGLINSIGQWILKEACLQTRVWRDRYPQYPELSISVNLSPRQYRDIKFISKLDKVLEDTNLDPRRLNLELTESVLVSQDKVTTDLFDQCKRRQIRLHMDDFGTGYSSLSYLHNLPIDAIKLDRSFVQNMDLSGKYTATVQAMVTLAYNRGIAMIAEGIETGGQVAQLQALDCEFGQGFYFARPMPAVEAEAVLASGSKTLRAA